MIPEHAGVIPSSIAHIRPGSIRAWLLACRPRTLPAAIVPVAVGTACATASHVSAPDRAAAALFGALLLQIGANFTNDLFDFRKGADTAERLGPTRAIQAGLLSPNRMWIGIAVVFSLALLCGIYLTVQTGPTVIVIGLASILAAFAYTGGPFPLAYHGLGEATVVAFFGFVAVCGTTFVQLGQVTELAWWSAVPVGTLASALLVVNNLRDRDTDAAAGKRTLAVLLGPRAARFEYALLVAVAFGVVGFVVATRQVGLAGLLPWTAAPFALALVTRAYRLDGSELNALLASTAKLLIVFGALQAAGLVLGS